MEICQQKDDIINKLQAAMDVTVENATRDVNAHFYFASSSQSLSSTNIRLHKSYISVYFLLLRFKLIQVD